SLARCRALYAAGRLEIVADPLHAQDLLADARELAVSLGDTPTLVMIDAALGLAAFRDERARPAIESINRALATVESLNDPPARARILAFGAWVLLTDHDRRE